MPSTRDVGLVMARQFFKTRSRARSRPSQTARISEDELAELFELVAEMTLSTKPTSLNPRCKCGGQLRPCSTGEPDLHCEKCERVVPL